MIDQSGHYIGEMKPESDCDIKDLIRQVIRDELEVKVTLSTDYVTDKVQGVAVELYLGGEQISWDEGD